MAKKKIIIWILAVVICCVVVFAACFFGVRYLHGFDLVYTPEIRSIKINNMVLPDEDGGQNHSAFTAEEEQEKVDIINMINDLDVKRRTDDLEDIGGDSPDITIDCYNQKEEKTYSIYFYGDIVTCEGGGIFSAGTYKIDKAEYDKIHELCCEYEGMSYKLDRNIDDLCYEYWKDIYSEEKNEIDFIVKWFQKNNFFGFCYTDDNNLYVSSSNKRQKLNKSKDVKRVIEFLKRYDAEIRGNWFNTKGFILSVNYVFSPVPREIYYHRYLGGNYFLVYAESEDLLNQFGVRKYKQVADNYYCFYTSYE